MVTVARRRRLKTGSLLNRKKGIGVAAVQHSWNPLFDDRWSAKLDSPSERGEGPLLNHCVGYEIIAISVILALRFFPTY